MGHRFLELASSPAARAEQARRGSRAAYARAEAGAPHHDVLGPEEAAFIAARDSAYIATVTPDGWPYLQHRGGPVGFLSVLDDRSIAFADVRGNRQYLTAGNVAGDGRAAWFLMDYARQRRLKLLGRMRVVEPEADAALAARLAAAGPAAPVERLFVLDVEGFDWNCPRHITPRFSLGEIESGLSPLRARLSALEAENAALRERLGESARA